MFVLGDRLTDQGVTAAASPARYLSPTVTWAVMMPPARQTPGAPPTAGQWSVASGHADQPRSHRLSGSTHKCWSADSRGHRRGLGPRLPAAPVRPACDLPGRSADDTGRAQHHSAEEGYNTTHSTAQNDSTQHSTEQNRTEQNDTAQHRTYNTTVQNRAVQHSTEQ